MLAVALKFRGFKICTKFAKSKFKGKTCHLSIFA